MGKDHQKLVADVLGTRLIAFNPDLARITGSVEAGLLLNQLLYWHKKGHNPEWFYKTIKEIQDETCLTRSQQDTAIKKCKKIGLFEMKRKGIPAKRHFRVDVEKIVELLRTLIKNDQYRQRVSIKLANTYADFKQSNTENPKRLSENTGLEKISSTLSKKYKNKYETNTK